jgi:hypothetical protein
MLTVYLHSSIRLPVAMLGHRDGIIFTLVDPSFYTRKFSTVSLFRTPTVCITYHNVMYNVYHNV